MNEKDYWVALEFRLCEEMAGIPECKARGLWCDGFLPDEYRLEEGACSVLGRAWICHGSKQAQWDFRLKLPSGTRELDEIEWERLLPPSEVTRWISVDFDGCTIDLDPGTNDS